jgi:hypothetical protein
MEYVNLIGFLSGFLLGTVLDMTLTQLTQEWTIVGAALIVSSIEILHKVFYYSYSKIQTNLNKKYSIIKILNILNYLKIGVIYGLVVDAYKLGS